MSRPGVRAVLLPTLLVAFLLSSGCESRYRRTPADAEMFGPQSMRIHPTFTRPKDWTGDGRSDGIEAVVELQDEFGEPTRATGKVTFEVYAYRPYYPDPRGKRTPDVWQWTLATRAEQAAHWSRALRAYSFKIPYDPGRGTVVLAGTFALAGGTPRLFDQIILEPEGRTSPVPEPTTTQPARPRRDAATRPVPTTQPIDPLDPLAPETLPPETQPPEAQPPDTAAPQTSTPPADGAAPPDAGKSPDNVPQPSQ
jgi:hypothetical protein